MPTSAEFDKKCLDAAAAVIDALSPDIPEVTTDGSPTLGEALQRVQIHLDAKKQQLVSQATEDVASFIAAEREAFDAHRQAQTAAREAMATAKAKIGG